MAYVPRYVPARTNDGWGVAALVFLLALACAVGAGIIHKRTYKHPTDPTTGSVNGRAAGHDAAAPAAH
jgi:hypothetical protein